MTWDGTGVDPWLPQRLASEITITAAERRLYQSWLGSMSAWLTRVKRSVLSGAVPDPNGVFSLVPAWADEMQRFVHDDVKDVMGISYRELFGDGYDFDSRPAVVKHLAGVSNRMVRTPDEVFDLIAGEVSRGAAAGLAIPDVAERIDGILSTTGSERWAGRAVTVSRTETVGALNAGRSDSFEAMQEELGEPMEQMWLATFDARTRDDHRAADGQRVPVGEPFDVGGESLDYPADPAGSASNTINCRCTVLILGADEEVDMSDRGWTDVDDDWEEQLDALDDSPTVRQPRLPEHRNDPRLLEDKARARQATIDATRRGGGVAAELDERVEGFGRVWDDDTTRVLDNVVAAQVARGALPQAVAETIRAAIRGRDFDGVTDAGWAYARTLDVEPVERAGTVVRFDPKLHKAIGEPIRGGDVFVVRPGLRWLDEDLVVEKAIVEVAEETDLFEARLARALSGQDALDEVRDAQRVLRADEARRGPGRLGTRDLLRIEESLYGQPHGYVRAGAVPLNAALRQGELTPAMAQQVADIDRMLELSSTPADLVVYRGVTGTSFGPDPVRPGTTFTDRGYSSTTVSEDHAVDFAQGRSTGGVAEHPTVLRVVVPQGSQAVKMSDLDFPGVGEVLLPRGVTYRIVADQGVVDGVRRLDVEVLPATRKSTAVRETDAPEVPDTARAGIEIRPVLAQARTAAAVSEAFQVEYERITGRAIDVELPPGASPATAREHFEGLLRGTERFPDAEMRQVSWFADDNAGYAETTAWEVRGTVSFNERWLTTSGRTGYLRSTARDAREGWHPVGFGGAADVAVHEFGHVLHLGVLGTQRAAIAQAVKAVLTRHAVARQFRHIDTRPEIAHSLVAQFEVSRYAATHTDELIAEAFLDVMANGSKASLLSREIFDILEEAYKTRPAAAVAKAVPRQRAVPARSTPEPEVDPFEARLSQALAGQDALDAAPAGLGRGRLPKAQRDALRDYYATYYGDINGQLRREEITPDTATRIRHIDAAMSGSSLTDDVVVFRGLHDGHTAFGDRLDGDLTGAVWTERSYVSTTALVEDAGEFALGDAPVVLRLAVPKGTGAVQLSKMWPIDEGELMLQRGLTFRVVKDRGVVDGVRQLDVEVVPATKAPTKVKAAKGSTVHGPAAEDAKVEIAAKAAKAPKLEIRPALLGGTPAKVAEKFQAEWRRITGRDITVEVPKGASGATLREHYEGLLRAAERFPLVELERVDWADLPAGEYAQAVVHKGGGRSLRFGAAWLGTAARTGYLRSLLRDVQTRWSPRGFTSPGAVAMHEFGHMLHLHSLVDAKVVTSKVRAALRRHAKAGGYVDDKGKAAPSLAARGEVSGTAAANIDELVGDAFADVLLNGPAASALSREVFDILERAYQDAAKVRRVVDEVVDTAGDLPSAKAPSLATILDEGLSSGHVAKADIARWIDGEYAGLRVQVDRAGIVSVYGQVTFSGRVFDPVTGKAVGKFQRRLQRDENGDLFSTHLLLEIHRKYQGSGFAAAFNNNLLDWYKRSGVKYVKVGANITVGGYTWARAGYDFADDNDAMGLFGALQSRLREIRGEARRALVWLDDRHEVPSWRWDGDVVSEAKPAWTQAKLRKAFKGASDAEIDRQLRIAQEFLDRLAGGTFGADDFPSAYELSQLGRWSGAGRDDVWIGKLIMLGSNWLGVLRL